MQPNIIQPDQPTQNQAASEPPVPTISEPTVVTSPVASPAELAAAAIPSSPQNMTSSQPVASTGGGGLSLPVPSVKMAVVFVVLILVFAGGYSASLGVSNVAHSNASKVARSFVAALNSGNNAKAYAMASSALHSQQSESQFAAAMGDLKTNSPKTDNESIAFNGRNTATYTLEQDGLPPTEDGTTSGTYTVSLVKSGLTGWKVDSVSVQ